MKLINELKVTSIRYFETNRGVGYDAKTKYGSILNDGNGGATYFYPKNSEGKKFRELSEWELESAIDTYEGVTECK